MKVLRRYCALATALLVPLLLLSALRSAEMPPAKSRYLAYVGTYTTKTASKGIYAFRYDADAGKLTPIGVAAETPDPSWVAIHPSGKYLYAVNEAGENSIVSAFALDTHSGKLTPLNQVPALGEDPCYISFDKTGKYVLVANYTSGNVAVFPVLPNGRVGEHTAIVQDAGAAGQNKERQDGPHAHWIEPSAGNDFIYVSDLGLDLVLVYRFDPSKGVPVIIRLSEWQRWSRSKNHPDRRIRLSPGTGPRHVTFSADEKFMYVLGELHSTLTVFVHDVKQGTFRKTQEISALPKGFSGRNDAAEIAIHPNGKFLYTSNRGHDSIAIFAIDHGEGTLTFAAHVSTGGKEPRHFAIDPTGKYLLAENQFSNNIVVFKIDPVTGGLTPTGQVVEVPSPVCITFVAAE